MAMQDNLDDDKNYRSLGCCRRLNMKAWVYVLDEFRPVDIEEEKLLELFEEGPLKLFEAVREVS